MSCLNATFTLTPKSPYFHPAFTSWYAWLWCYGADFRPYGLQSFSALYSADRFFFENGRAGDPTVDYSQWAARMRAPFLELHLELGSTNKELALIFGFDMFTTWSRILVYDDYGMISDQTLQFGDNQFLLEIEPSNMPMNLYFIHAGGYWYFKGISGYLV